MNKGELIAYLDQYEDGDEIDLDVVAADFAEEEASTAYVVDGVCGWTTLDGTVCQEPATEHLGYCRTHIAEELRRR